MADIALTVYETSRATPSAVNFTDNKVGATTGNNYQFVNDGRVVLITSASGGANITVTTQMSVDAKAVADDVLVAGTAKTCLWGPFPPAIYNDANGKVTVTVSANTDLMAVRV